MNYPFEIPQITWLPILPMVIVAITGMVALVFQMTRKGVENSGVVNVSLFGLAMALAVSLGSVGKSFTLFSGMVTFNALAYAGQIIVLITTMLSVALSSTYLKEKKITFGEVYPLMLWAALGSMILCCTKNLLLMFVGIEILSVALYVLAGLNRGEQKSEEAAMKYFLLGAFATGFFLYGIAFYYGSTGTLDLEMFTAGWRQAKGESGVMMLFSFALLLIGLGFKCSLMPFHQWTPDVYVGSPTNITAFMATVGKVGPFVALSILASSMTVINEVTVPVLAAIAVITMVLGNILAFVQNEIKKLFAYSSIANAGYVLVSIIAGAKNPDINTASLAYFILGYTVTTFGAFAVVALSSKDGEEPVYIEDLKGLSQRSPMVAGALSVFVLSLIGIGPVSGFVGKLLIVGDAVRVGMIWLAVVLVLSSLFGAYYYFGLLRTCYSSDSDEPALVNPLKLSAAQIGTFAVCVVATIGTVIFFPVVMALLGLK